MPINWSTGIIKKVRKLNLRKNLILLFMWLFLGIWHDYYKVIIKFVTKYVKKSHKTRDIYSCKYTTLIIFIVQNTIRAVQIRLKYKINS